MSSKSKSQRKRQSKRDSKKEPFITDAIPQKEPVIADTDIVDAIEGIKIDEVVNSQDFQKDGSNQELFGNDNIQDNYKVGEKDVDGDVNPDFANGDAEAGLTYPKKCALALRGHGHVVMNGRPCKIISYKTAAPGKHGHAKSHYVGIDIFTGKKYDDYCPTHSNLDVPIIKRTEYIFSFLDNNGFVSMIGDHGELRSDLSLPNDYELANDIQTRAKSDEEFLITVLSAMGEEQIVSVKSPPRANQTA